MNISNSLEDIQNLQTPYINTNVAFGSEILQSSFDDVCLENLPKSHSNSTITDLEGESYSEDSFSRSSSLHARKNSSGCSVKESNLVTRSKKIYKEKSDVSNLSSPSSTKRRSKSKSGGRNFWTPEEDAKAQQLIKEHGPRWSLIGELIGHKTCKQVRDRYLNFLRPNINNEPFTTEEDCILRSLYEKIGAKWKSIADQMAGRTEIQVKNRYYRFIKKQMEQEIQGGLVEPAVKPWKKQKHPSVSFSRRRVDTRDFSGEPSFEAKKEEEKTEEHGQETEEWFKFMGHHGQNRIVIGMREERNDEIEKEGEEMESGCLEDVFYQLNLEPAYAGTTLENHNGVKLE